MYHYDTQYFGEDYAKGADSTAIALVVGGKSVFIHTGNIDLINTRKWGKTSFFQQFGRAIRIKPKSNYFDRVPANTRLAKSTVFKRMRDLSQI